jgi:hypothetical protein
MCMKIGTASIPRLYLAAALSLEAGILVVKWRSGAVVKWLTGSLARWLRLASEYVTPGSTTLCEVTVTVEVKVKVTAEQKKANVLT